MKFGKTIRNKALPKWSMHYMDYKALKKIIRKCMVAKARLEDARAATRAKGARQDATQEQPRIEPEHDRVLHPDVVVEADTDFTVAGGEAVTSDPEQEYQTCVTYFFFLLQRQLEKVSGLFADEGSLLQARIMAISDKFNQMAVQTPLPEEDFRRHTAAKLLRGVNDILTTQHNLRDFSHMNKEGFRKILKKLDKRLGTDYAANYMSKRVNVASFANSSEVLDPLEHRARRLKQRLERVLGVKSSSSALLMMHAGEHKEEGYPRDAGLHDPVGHGPPGLGPRNMADLLDSGRFSDLDAAFRHVDPAQRPAIMDELLVRACQEANSEGMRYCLRHNGNTLHHTEPHGYTCWHILVRWNRLPQLRLLISTLKKRQMRRAFSETDAVGQTVLHLAAAYNRVDALRLFADNGADVDVMASNGFTPLLAAIHGGQTEAATALLELGADPDLFNSELSSCLSPLATAAEKGDAAVVKALLDAGADDTVTDLEGEVALHKACAAGHVEAAQLLIQHNRAMVNKRDEYELHTPLFLCTKNKHQACARLLLENGAVANARDIRGWTPHSYAMYYGYIPFAEELIRWGAGGAKKRSGCCAGKAKAHTDGDGSCDHGYDDDDHRRHHHHHHGDGRHGHMRALAAWARHSDEESSGEEDEGREEEHAGVRHGAKARLQTTKGKGKPMHSNEAEGVEARGAANKDKGQEDKEDEMSEEEEGHSPELRKLMVDPRQPLDVTSFIDKEGKYRMRGSEKTVPVTQRTYGHEYLRDAARGFVDIHPMRDADAMQLVDAEGLSIGVRQCILQCAIIFHEEEGTAPRAVDTALYKQLALPLNEDGDSFTFDFTVEDVERYATLEFRLVSVFDPTVVVACGRLPDRLWQRTDEEHTTHEVVLFNRRLQAVFPLRFRYLLVLPYQGSELRIQPHSTYWTTRKQLPVWGHRGTGSSKAAHVESNTYRTHVQENTVLSFVTAANLGAEYVEFDVQLTRDKVPVIYHNWTLADVLGFDVPVDLVTLEAFLSIKERRRDDVVRFGLDSDERLSVRETTPVHKSRHNSSGSATTQGSGSQDGTRGEGSGGAGGSGMRSQVSPSLPLQGITSRVDETGASSKLLAQPQARKMGRPRSYSSPDLSNVKMQGLDIDPKRYVRAPLATLKEALTLVPESLGFNIEIKYPLEDHQHSNKLQSWEMNTFVDTTLDVIFAHAGDRKIVFSCFHPDMCRILSLKQPCYPVLFLTTAGHKENFTDARAMSLRAAVRFASSANLLGIVSNSHPLVLCPELIHQVKSSGLLLLTWGDENNDVDCVRLQEACGVDAVIVDHIAHIRKGLRPRSEAPLA